MREGIGGLRGGRRNNEGRGEEEGRGRKGEMEGIEKKYLPKP